MFTQYFQKAESEILKKYSASSSEIKKPIKKTKDDYSDIIEMFGKIIPSSLVAVRKSVVDEGGYRIDSADILFIEKIYPDIENIFSECVPSSIVRAIINVCRQVNPKQLSDLLDCVNKTKKLDQFVENKTNGAIIPCFAVALDSIYDLKELKLSIMNQNQEKNIPYLNELDILIHFGKGLVIKDWHNKNNYIAIETGKDSLKWFFILMNEYLTAEKPDKFDLRKFVVQSGSYPEY